jgi:hypothetical protein
MATLLRRLFPAALVAVCAVPSLAQNEEDALRFSQLLPGGTARSWGLAGAFGAVGADPGSAGVNPAGMGLYNNSELSLTAVLGSQGARSTFYGQAATSSESRFAVNNFALVLNYPKPGKDWRGATFGMTYDRHASFHGTQNALATDVPSTLLQRFANEAGGTSYTDLEADAFPFTSTLAWFTYGIDTVPGTGDQYAPGIPFGSPVTQEHRVDAGGRVNNTGFFYANNWMDRIYIGAALGLVGMRYSRTTFHKETSQDQDVDLERMSYQEDLLTTGNGVDLKLGIIGRVGDHLRLGGAFHSPMWMLMNDSYNYAMRTSFRSGDGFSESSPEGTFSYRLNTPWRAVASAVYQAGRHGIISVDYTYADMRQARLRPSRQLAGEYDFALENQFIGDRFRATHALRVGTEWRSGRWYFRGGWAFRGDPFADGDAQQGTALRQYCGGFGYRTEHLSLDLAGVVSTRDNLYYPYSSALVQSIRQELTDVSTLFTVALRP